MSYERVNWYSGEDNLNDVRNLVNSSQKSGLIYFSDNQYETIADIKDTTGTGNVVLESKITDLQTQLYDKVDSSLLQTVTNLLLGMIGIRAYTEHTHSYNDLTEKPTILTLTDVGNITQSSNINTSNYILNTSNAISNRINNLSTASSQWIKSGNIVYNQNEKIGIGTTATTYKLEVQGDTYLKGTMKIAEEWTDYDASYPSMVYYYIFTDNGSIIDVKDGYDMSFIYTTFYNNFYYWHYKRVANNGVFVSQSQFENFYLNPFPVIQNTSTFSLFINIPNITIPTQEFFFITGGKYYTNNIFWFSISYSSNPLKLNLRLSTTPHNYAMAPVLSFDFDYNKSTYISLVQDAINDKVIIYFDGVKKGEVVWTNPVSVEEVYICDTSIMDNFEIYIANISLFSTAFNDAQIYNLYLSNSFYVNSALVVNGRAKINTVDYKYLKQNGSNINFNDTKHFEYPYATNKITYEKTSSGTKRDLYIDNIMVNGTRNITNQSLQSGYMYFSDGLTTTTGSVKNTIPISDITNLQSSLDLKQNTLTAGTNISIIGNTISSTGGGTTITDVGNIVNASNLNTSNYVLNTSNVISNRITGLNNVSLSTIGNIALSSNLNTSNYVLNTSNVISNRITGLNNVSLTTIGNIALSSNLNTSNYVLNTSNTIITQLNAKQATITASLGCKLVGTNISLSIPTVNTDKIRPWLSGNDLFITQITGGASTIVDTDLEINRTLLSSGAGKVSVSTITNTELQTLTGIGTTSIINQLSTKQNTLTAGTNITINTTTNTISSTATSQWTTNGTSIGYTGSVHINAGNTTGIVNDTHVQSGSLVIGDIGLNYGSDPAWPGTNTGGLILQCADNTEIIAHDAGLRLQPLISYFGGLSSHRIEINKPHPSFASTTRMTILHGDVGIGTTQPTSTLDVNGTITGNLGFRSFTITGTNLTAYASVGYSVSAMNGGNMKNGTYTYSVLSTGSTYFSYGTFLLGSSLRSVLQFASSGMTCSQNGGSFMIANNTATTYNFVISITNTGYH